MRTVTHNRSSYTSVTLNGDILALRAASHERGLVMPSTNYSPTILCISPSTPGIQHARVALGQQTHPC